MARLLRQLTILAIALGTAGCGTSPTEPGDGLAILFVGNSLLSSNDLPTTVLALLESLGRARNNVASVTAPGFQLKDHWDTGVARQELRRRPWDFVILQEGPPGESPDDAELIEYAGKFARDARSFQARPALLMTWPVPSQVNEFDSLVDAYVTAADAAQAMLFPAGEAWQAVWGREPEYQLYSPEDAHPNKSGSYLTALVIVSAILGVDPRDLSPDAGQPGLSGAQVELLQEAAAEATGHQPAGQRR